MSIIYFDTNVYHHIIENSQLDSVRKLLEQHRHTIMCSYDVILEAMRAPGKRHREMGRAIAELSSGFFEEPPDLLEANEFLAEVARQHPTWRQKHRSDASVKQFLRARKKTWTQLRLTKELPAPLTEGHERYLELSEAGIRFGKEQHKQVRSVLGHSPVEALDTRIVFPPDSVLKDAEEAIRSIPSIERFVRISSAQTIWAALTGLEVSRDLLDWTRPHLRLDRLDAETFHRFWLTEVDVRRVPHTYWYWLVRLAQYKYKFTHGNYADCGHAGYLPRVRMFFTADATFFKTMEIARERYSLLDLGVVTLLGPEQPVSSQIAAALG